jgi:hypothetical protein
MSSKILARSTSVLVLRFEQRDADDPVCGNFALISLNTRVQPGVRGCSNVLNRFSGLPH